MMKGLSLVFFCTLLVNFCTSEDDDDGKTRKLYAQIKIKTNLNDSVSAAMEKVLYQGVIVKNKILTSQLSTTGLIDSVRYCYSIELPETVTIDRETLKKLFIKAVSKAFGGKYDKVITVDILTSSAYFCKRNYFGKKPYYLYPNNGGTSITTLSSLTAAVSVLCWSFLYLK